MTQEQFNKLPKWAQQEFSTLQIKIRDLEKDVALLKEEELNKKTPIAIKNLITGAKKYIPTDYDIEFDFGDLSICRVLHRKVKYPFLNLSSTSLAYPQ